MKLLPVGRKGVADQSGLREAHLPPRREKSVCAQMSYLDEPSAFAWINRCDCLSILFGVGRDLIFPCYVSKRFLIFMGHSFCNGLLDRELCASCG
jgi:hypothetical protein